MVCKRSRLGTALLRIAMPAPAFYAVVTMLFTAQFMGLAGQAVAAEFIGVAAAMRGDVIRVSSASSEIPSGPLESGTRIYLGDKIEVATDARMQILLLDETVFTLGSGARLTIDEFVFDPSTQSGSVTTQITKGAFRFVSGKLAKSSPTAMKVQLPTATLSIRGTQVAGLVEEDGDSQVILVGPGPNDFGATLGAVTVTNDFGSIDLTQPNFATVITPNAPPTTPALATPEVIDQIEQSTGEEAETVIAEALDVESLEIVPATDSDNDGILDLIAANTMPQRMSAANKNKAETATAGMAIPLSDWGRISASIAGTNTRYPNIEVTSQIHRRDYKQRTRIGLLVNGTLFSRNLSAMTIGLSGATTRNDSTIRQYDYKRSDVSLTVNYRLTD